MPVCFKRFIADETNWRCCRFPFTTNMVSDQTVFSAELLLTRITIELAIFRLFTDFLVPKQVLTMIEKLETLITW